ncbi:hypothetical protein AGMMS49944_04090 [Spirochaetia bacterium]|nr:hypothetical protein AGMMS49944_04090 [Spirochaetia bacterium]
MGHRISNRDIMLDDLDDLFQGEKADCLYSDPPWGLGNLKYWRTMNGQKGVNVEWIAFLERIKFLYQRHVKGPLFLETGVRFQGDLEGVFGKSDAVYTVIYNTKLPNMVMCWGAVPRQSPEGTSGIQTPYTVLSTYGTIPNSIFDCCVGLGIVAKTCKKLGATCYANELNPKRMAVTQKILPFETV